MKLGLHVGYWGAGPPAGAVETILEAERLGYDSVWTAEAYGSDAVSPLAWWGSKTTRIRLGTNLIQLSARTPTATAMAAITLDHLSGGRFVLGLGVSGPQVVEGWYGQSFPKFFSPREQAVYQKSLDEGFGRPGARRTPDTFEVAATVPVIIHDDVEQAADFMRPTLALYVGGMGARGRNFHFDVFARMGYEAEATRIQDLYLDGKKDEAAAAVPTAMVEDVYLVGPKDKIRDDLEAWKESMITTVIVAGDPDLLRTMAELVL